MRYEKYISSEAWRALKLKMLRGIGETPCIACGSRVLVTLHHITYVRMGHERPEDLAPLCRTCHSKFHESTGRGRNMSVGEFLYLASRCLPIGRGELKARLQRWTSERQGTIKRRETKGAARKAKAAAKAERKLAHAARVTAKTRRGAALFNRRASEPAGYTGESLGVDPAESTGFVASTGR